MAHDVFISYSSKDKPIADAICASIEATGIRCWIAPRDIAAGEDWPTAISNAISASRVMVLLFSSNSNSSEDVGRELNLAASSKLIIIPFKIDDIEPEPGKRYYLARTHWLDAMNPPTEEQIQILVNRVKFVISNLDAEQGSGGETSLEPGRGVPAPKTGSRPAPPGKSGKVPAGRPLTLAIGGVCLLIFAFLAIYYGIIQPKANATPQTSATAIPTEAVILSDTPTQALAATSAPTDVPAPTTTLERVPIRWFVGLDSSGTSADAIAIEQQVVDDFNASHDNIKLTLEVVPSDSAENTLMRQINSGSGPDIVGPQNWGKANLFHGQWLDLTSYMGQVDTNQYNPVMMSMYLSEEGQVALPFQIQPPLLFYNPAVFDQAGLYYPPAKYGDNYTWKGLSVEWSWYALADVARLLTKDKNGRNATETGFDKNNIVQYGFHFVWGIGPNPYFGGGSIIKGELGNFTAVIPDAWKDAWRWTYDGMWGSQPFIPTSQVASSTEFGQWNTFNSGRIAMTAVPSWYLCCLQNYIAAGNKFDLGILPDYYSSVHGRMEEAAFRVWKGSKHPAESFEVLNWLSTVGIDKLVIGATESPSAFGSALPGISSKQPDAIALYKDEFPFVTQWEVLSAGLSYPDIPGMQAWMPNSSEIQNRLASFQDLMNSRGNLNLENEISILESDLTAIFNK
jgi:multiple sugar transport system substrate-binding protein